MLDKSFWQETSSSASQGSVRIVRRTVSISTTCSEGRQEVRTTLKISSRYVQRVTDGFTTTPPSREREDGLLPVTV
jgi:hypothetical protein